MTPQDLPGGDQIAAGLDDLRAGRETAAALLVAIGAPRLRRLGLDVPRAADGIADPERRLYELLARGEGDPSGGDLSAGDAAHGRYNALVRRLVRFERAAESVPGAVGGAA